MELSPTNIVSTFQKAWAATSSPQQLYQFNCRRKKSSIDPHLGYKLPWTSLGQVIKIKRDNRTRLRNDNRV